MESVDRISEIKASIDAGRTIRRVDVKYLLSEIAAMQTELAQLKEAQRWIPVEESLPVDELVYVLWRGGDLIAEYRPGEGWWNDALGVITEVTHWAHMLPDPPVNGDGNTTERKDAE